MYYSDTISMGFRTYMEHTTGVPESLKSVPQGFTITDQDSDGNYTYESIGNEGGWSFHRPNTRELGMWHQLMPCICTAESAAGWSTVQPVADASLIGDYGLRTQYAGVFGGYSGSLTMARSVNGAAPKLGEIGFVIQASNHGEYERLWVQFKPFNDLWEILPSLNSWYPHNNKPIHRTDCSFNYVAYYFILGGMDWDDNVLEDFWYYDNSNDSWSKIADTTTLGARYGNCTFNSAGLAYMGGGYDSSGSELADLYLWGGSTTFTACTSAPVSYSYTELYSTGTTVFLYKPNTPANFYVYYPVGWTPPPDEDSWATNATSGDSVDAVKYAGVTDLYISGGELVSTGISTNQFYKISTLGVITLLSSMPKKLKRHAILHSGGNIYVFGGIDENDKLNNVTYKYVISTDTWSTPTIYQFPSGRWGVKGADTFIFGGKRP